MKFFAGYRAMIRYLDEIWEQTKSDSLGALLGSMAFLSDGRPIDAAVESDWNQAVDTAAAQIPANAPLDELAYRSTLAYLKNWLDIGLDAEIETIYLGLLNHECSEVWEFAVLETFS